MSSGFVDKVRITIKSGNGGNGAVAFHREKYVASGGPDGGDGGNGGDIIFVPDDNITTLLDFRYKRKYIAENGEDGQGKRCSGKDGRSLYIKVPRGTVVRDYESGCIMHDMSDGESWTAAKGGRGGWGNIHFATPTRQTPRFAKPGLPGETLDIILELKLLADVGLIGFPNVGKSTFLSVVSKAHPKIANYHFTTLFPNLGVVYVNDGNSFVLADIPGIIEGASDGAGLGTEFLRHIERCRLFVHIIDVSGSEGRDPVDDYRKINDELRRYDPELLKRPQIIVANKADLISDHDSAVNLLKEEAEKDGFPFFLCSAASHSGVRPIIDKCYELLEAIPVPGPYEADYVPKLPSGGSVEDLQITVNDGIWNVEGEWIRNLIARINFSDYESRMFFDRLLRESGVFSRLENMGIRDGDTVCIYDLSFDYRE